MHHATTLHDPDPCGLIRAFLAAPSPDSAAAERTWLAWVLSLDAGFDPAEAARTVIAGLGEGELALPQQRRLVDLLATTTRWPRAAVAGLRHGPCRGRRRRGIAIG